MFSEDGGVGTVSSSVRRTRSSRGVFPFTAEFWRVGSTDRVAEGRRDVVRTAFFTTRARARAAGRGVRDGFAGVRAPRFAAAFFVGRLAERFAAGRFFVAFAVFARCAALRLAMALVLSEP
jgi:hypothetical protein